MYWYEKMGSNSRLRKTENWPRLRVHFFRALPRFGRSPAPYIAARANSIRIYALEHMGCKLSLFQEYKYIRNWTKYIKAFFFAVSSRIEEQLPLVLVSWALCYWKQGYPGMWVRSDMWKWLCDICFVCRVFCMTCVSSSNITLTIWSDC